MIRQRFFTILALIIIAGCAQLGLQAPTTLDQDIAATTVGITSVRNAAATLVMAGKLTPDDGQNVQTQADTIRAGVTIARSLSATNPVAAKTKLTASIAMLTALQTYLDAQGAPK